MLSYVYVSMRVLAHRLKSKHDSNPGKTTIREIPVAIRGIQYMLREERKKARW